MSEFVTLMIWSAFMFIAGMGFANRQASEQIEVIRAREVSAPDDTICWGASGGEELCVEKDPCQDEVVP